MAVVLQTLLVNLSADYWDRSWVESLTTGVTLDYVTPDTLDVDKPTLVMVYDIGGEQSAVVAGVLARFRAAGRPAGLIHFGDECYWCDLAHYRDARFVVRNYWRPDCPPALDGRVEFLPLGYKAHFTEHLTHRPISERPYRWSFAGEPKGRRVKMLAAMARVPGGRVFKTTQWNDPNALTTRQYAELMSDSVFVPCPRGNESVDCFRVYEALEAGAIPVVEDDGRFAPLLDRLAVPASVRHKRFARGNARYRAAFGVSYWLSLFGPDFPLPRVWDWRAAPRLIERLDVPAVAASSGTWWAGVKHKTAAVLARRLADLADG